MEVVVTTNKYILHELHCSGSGCRLKYQRPSHSLKSRHIMPSYDRTWYQQVEQGYWEGEGGECPFIGPRAKKILQSIWTSCTHKLPLSIKQLT